MEASSKTVVCPFYRVSRHFTVRFCDNLVSGVPACVVAGFWMADVSDVEICPHFVRSDVFEAVKKSGCFFGGSCVYPAVEGFGACSVVCPRFKEGSS